ncbi:MAG: c-type cytochrome [Gemmatimonadetes bacterium]|nr:c-type cytochrome [Gemmatimonadota bacterium]
MAERVFGARACAAAAVAVLLSGCTALDDFTARVPIFARSMRTQPSFDPYEDPRLGPEGAVPFASGNYPARGAIGLGQAEGPEAVPPPFTQAELDAVAAKLANPVDPTEESLARGKVLFERTCAPCHGPEGGGATGYIIPAGFPPFPLVSDRVRGFTDGYIYGMIRVGRNFMPAYGSMVSYWDHWNIVNYVRKLQQDAAAAAAAPPLR